MKISQDVELQFTIQLEAKQQKYAEVFILGMSDKNKFLGPTLRHDHSHLSEGDTTLLREAFLVSGLGGLIENPLQDMENLENCGQAKQNQRKYLHMPYSIIYCLPKISNSVQCIQC